LALSAKLDLQLEWGFRRTYTDHIDDVSGTYADNNVLLEEAGPLTALSVADPSALRTTRLQHRPCPWGFPNARLVQLYRHHPVLPTYAVHRM
jgi:hypothetical protein